MRLVVAACLLVACSDPNPAIVIHSANPAVTRAATDAGGDLAHVTAIAPTFTASLDAGCVDAQIDVVVREASDLAAQAYAISETRCDHGGHLVVIRGGSEQAMQWGLYDLMERLGVRYFHPEQSLYPKQLAWPSDPIEVVEQPGLADRSFHLHTTHPIELSAPLGGSTATYQKNWVDWNVKLRQTTVDGVDEGAIGSYAYDRGFPRGTGLNLVETQQGGIPVIDPTDPRPESEQIAAAIDRVMAPVDGMPAPTRFSFSFNPSEFTTADEQTTVDRITFVTQYINSHWPDVEVRTINHGTAQPPGPVYGVRFFDLSQFAPPELGVEVHTLMFYDLDRPAPVYGNADFHMLRDWIVTQQASRRITYYPETSWWLTFDLPVPLYLAPVSLEARDHDLKLLAPYATGDNGAATGIVGHKAFTSGQEWGYWLIDYCTARMTWQLDLGWVGCLDHVASAFESGDALRDLLVDVGTAQVDPMRDPDILAMLVGSDDGTETAASAGIIFHPLPPTPASILAWDDATVAQFQQRSLDRLPALAAAYEGWAMRADAIAAAQDDDHKPWIAEIADGLRITGLRAEHALKIYSTVLALRTAIHAHDYAAVATAGDMVAAATDITTRARAIVTAREAAYRYPKELSIAGDEVGTDGAIPNQTIYPYRYLSRTHRLFYWTRPDDQLAAMFGFDVVSPNARMILDGTPLTVAVTAAVTDLSIAWGDGATSALLEPHTYATQGLYDWTLDALETAGAIHHVDRVAVVSRILRFSKGSLTITSPMGGSLIAGLLPGLAIGLGTDGGGAFVALGQLDTTGPEITNGSIQRRPLGATADLSLQLSHLGAVTIYGATITTSDGAGPTDRKLALAGELATQEIIDLVVTAGGFDPDGARSAVASALGYTVDTLPARVPFAANATGVEP